MTFGVTVDGFVQKTTENILEELAVDQRENVDPAIDTSSESPVGQMNGVFSNQLAEAWEALATAYKGFDPDNAEGEALDALSSLTGTLRDPATRTLVTRARVNLDDGFSALAGEMVAHIANDPDSRFVNVDPVENTSGGVQEQLITFQAENTGPIVVNDDALNTIAEPLTGWNSVINQQSPNPDNSQTSVGTNVQTDTELRVSRQEELRGQGGATAPAIDAALEAVDGVITVTVFFNDEDTPDADGVPGHSIECLIYDGPAQDADDTELAQTIFDNKAAGIRAFGDEYHNATDQEGGTHPMGFTRPTLEEIWFDVDITEDPNNQNADVVNQVKEAIANKGTEVSTPGRDVIANEYVCAAIEVPGVLDVPTLRLDFSSSPTNENNLTIPARDLAIFSTARVTVNIIP